MPDRIVGGRVVPDRRSQYHMEPIQAIAEPVLKELYPRVARRPSNDDEIQPWRICYDEIWRDHADDIVDDIHAFADVHPVDEQRTDGAIKYWAYGCGEQFGNHHTDMHGDRSYYCIAVHVGLLAYTAHMRALRTRMYCEHGWYRVIERFHDACSGQPGYGFISASEKWGGLNLVYRCDPAVQERCREAERVAIGRASHTCEVCGLAGELRMLAWRKTLCDEHMLLRQVDYTEAEYERLAAEYAAGRPRWQPIVQSWQDEGLSADQIYDDFMQQFADLDEPDRRFWAVHCTRSCLLMRGREEGRSRDEGV
ncbi:hypothetical protein [Rhizobium leguminosarum]|uniref:hypothetical protein n=1 Tax=Rhizobium leguminosarum TaxID=384 RepID=UPI0013B80D4F|nr:hypothetical protein [Rhizobium leguminosarum]NEI64961.1 hypothetical protein [Rhizobium leguminosarum]